MSTLPPWRGYFNGTVNGSPTDTVGVFDKYGSAYEFDGTAADYIEIPASFAESFGGNPFVTVEAWVQIQTTVSDQTILVVTDGANAERLWFGLDATGKWEVRARAKNADTLRTLTSTGATPSVGWHHVGAIVDIPGDTMYLYVDGILEHSGAADFGTNQWFNADSGNQNRIGANAAASPGAGWDGKIASVGVHWRKLSEGEFNLIWRLGRRGVIT